jgi:hypothetical protein
MKLSLWQQFSSNNSVGYIVIGVFETPAAAQQAKAVLDEMIREMRTPPPPQSPVSPREIQAKYARRYGLEINPEYGISWFNTLSYGHRGQNTGMTLFNRYLFIDTYDEVLQRAEGEPLQEFVAAMGATAHLRMGISHDFRMRLRCTAPNIETANQIQQAVETHVQLAEDMDCAPSAWVRHNMIEQTSSGWPTPAQYDGLEQAWHAWYQMILRLKDPDIQEERRHLAEEVTVLGGMMWQWEQGSLPYAEFTQDGLQIVIEETRPKAADQLEYLMSTLTHWLQALGCEVDYDFVAYEDTE